MADGGYDEFLSILAAAPSKDDVKKAETSFKARRASLAKHVTNNAEKQTARPKVDRMSSATWHVEPPGELEEKDRVSTVRWDEREGKIKTADGLLVHNNYDGRYGSFVYMTDADFNDAPTVISTNITIHSSVFERLTLFMAKIAIKTIMTLASVLVQILWVLLLVFAAWIYATLYCRISDWQTHQLANGVIIWDWQTQLADGVSILNILVTFSHVWYHLTGGSVEGGY